METAITTIARYETDRPPRGRTLVKLVLVARQNNRDDLADIFQKALGKDMGLVLGGRFRQAAAAYQLTRAQSERAQRVLEKMELDIECLANASPTELSAAQERLVGNVHEMRRLIPKLTGLTSPKES
jgi:hypothetical protein